MHAELEEVADHLTDWKGILHRRLKSGDTRKKVMFTILGRWKVVVFFRGMMFSEDTNRYSISKVGTISCLMISVAGLSEKANEKSGSAQPRRHQRASLAVF